MTTELSTILIIDDDDFFRESLADLLQDEGFLVHEAKDGMEAIQSIENERPDLAIVDLSMPRLHGLELIERIRKTDNLLPLIVCTSKSGLKDDFSVRTMDIFDFLVKPVDAVAVVDRIHRALDAAKKKVEALPLDEPVNLL